MTVGNTRYNVADTPTEGDPTDAAAIIDPGTSNHYFGDQRDDDGQALDSYLQAAPDSPVPSTLVEYDVPALPVTTRVLARTLDLTNYSVGQSVLLWPKDPNRQRLHIEALDNDMSFPFSGSTGSNVDLVAPFAANVKIGGAVTFLANVTVTDPGSLLLQGSFDQTNWVTLQAIGMTSTGVFQVTTTVRYPYYRVRSTTPNTGAGQVAGGVSYPVVPVYSWGSDPISPLSPAPFQSVLDIDSHTGPVYVAKTSATSQIISSHVVTV